MFIDQINKFLNCFFLVLFSITYYSLLSAQQINKDRVTEIQESLIIGDLNKVCKLIENSIFRNRMYFIEGPVPSDITVFVSDRSFSSDSFKVTASVRQFADRSPFVFEISFGSIRIDSFRVEERVTGIRRSYPFEDSWQLGKLMYVKLMIIGGIKHRDVEFIPCRKPLPGGFMDKPIIPLPLIHRKLTPLTASSGTIAICSTVWFLKERCNANKHFNQYKKAVTMEDAVHWRDKVQISRTRRNTAGIIATAADLTFGILFVRNVFFQKCETEDHCVSPSYSGFPSESRFCISPELSDEQLTFSICLKF